jgi:hypothetical protein
MGSIFTRLFTFTSLVLLLVVVQFSLTLHSMSHEISIIELPHLPKFVSLEMKENESQEQAVQSSAELAYEQHELIEFKTQTIAYQAPKRAQKINFKKIDKEINILDEVFSSPVIDEKDNTQWIQIQGSTTIPSIIEMDAKVVNALEIDPTKLVALVDLIKFPEEEVVMVAEVKTPEYQEIKDKVIIADTISVQSAKSVNVEPEFFDYSEPIAEKNELLKHEVASEEIQEKYTLPQEVSQKNIADVDTQKVTPKMDEITTFSYIAPQRSDVPRNTNSIVAASGLKSPKGMTIQNPPQKISNNKVSNTLMSTHGTQVVVKPLSVSSQTQALRHFDLRAQDEVSTVLQDNGSGQIVISEVMSTAVNSKSFTILQREHVPTHIDLPMAVGKVEISVPVLDKEFAEKFMIRNMKLTSGIVLIELDEETDDIFLDGQVAQKIKLTHEFKKTDSSSEYQYLLFTGVEVGNRLMTAIKMDGSKAQRIIHVYEEEVTFDPNLYGDKSDLVIELKEEGLLSRQKRDLSISGDQAVMTFSNSPSQKISSSVYKFKGEPLLLGARHYLTLNHLPEELFVGVDSSKTVDVPSEALMREVIRKFGMQGHQSACLIQVNLDKKAKKYDVLAESHLESHVSYGLVLDEDGELYESLGDQSRKIFIMSESQGSEKLSRNAKINIKIEYVDGTHKSFSSFCSPNTYLVEQL